MQLAQTSIFLLLLFSGSLTAQTQSSFECDSILDLWKQKKFAKLLGGLDQVDNKPSKTAKETTALAFRDYIFLGDLLSAKNKLELVLQKYQGSKSQFPNEFGALLDTVLNEINQEIRIHAERGKTNDQIKANANPSAIRDAWGDESHPIIDLIKPLQSRFPISILKISPPRRSLSLAVIGKAGDSSRSSQPASHNFSASQSSRLRPLPAPKCSARTRPHHERQCLSITSQFRTRGSLPPFSACRKAPPLRTSQAATTTQCGAVCSRPAA